jgi:large subunit ribosomal protein L18
MAVSNRERRAKIKRRVRAKVNGTAARPRLTVFRSNSEFYAQLVDDVNNVTLVAATSLGNKDLSKVTKTEQAAGVGKLLAEKAIAAGLVDVVFDRNGYLYHGRVKAFADGAREGGLKF